MYVGKCGQIVNKLQPLSFQFSDDWIFAVKPENYLVEMNSMGFDLCMIGVTSLSKDIGADLYVIGASFLRDYISIYDFENNRVGLALHNASTGSVTKKSAKKVSEEVVKSFLME